MSRITATVARPWAILNPACKSWIQFRLTLFETPIATAGIAWADHGVAVNAELGGFCARGGRRMKQRLLSIERSNVSLPVAFHRGWLFCAAGAPRRRHAVLRVEPSG